MAWTAAGLVSLQVVLGFLGAYTVLSVLPVSLHTLVAASLLAAGVALTCRGMLAPGTSVRAAAPGVPASTT
jgi:heme A synthase